MSDAADVNIHLRARPRDRDLIDQAAELAGLNRSQFMLTASLRAAKDSLLDRAAISVDSKAFQAILAIMDAPSTPQESEGLKRLKSRPADWSRD